MLKEDDEINKNLRFGIKSSKWYFVPYDSVSDYYNTKSAKECFMTDYGPDHFSEGLARFLSGQKMGLLDEQGEIQVAAKYDYISKVENHLAVVCLGCLKNASAQENIKSGAKWGVIDRSGKVVVPIIYAEIDFDPWAKKISVRSNSSSSKKNRKRNKRRTILIRETNPSSE